MKHEIKLEHQRKKNSPEICDLVVKSNIMLAPSVYLIALKSNQAIKPCLPGQFAMLKAKCGDSGLLARPFSIYWYDEYGLEFLYKVCGRATTALSASKEGDLISVLGPLGNSFVPSMAKEIVFVAGGIGIAPFPFLLHSFFKDRKVTIFLGNQSKSQVILLDVLKNMNANVLSATDDGSFAQKGFVTDVLEDYLNKRKEDASIEAYICGPKAMEKRAVEILNSYQIPSQVAMEENMACGLGVCMGCVVPCKDHDSEIYKRVCIEGPIFYGDEIIW